MTMPNTLMTVRVDPEVRRRPGMEFALLVAGRQCQGPKDRLPDHRE